ncbi:MAG: metallophosphoesterase family protein [Bacteroidota bacterium]|nr:metallophosphoesterase family protein [Bacteroidota bacterium]
MKIAIISDIHSNLEALTKVMDEIHERKISDIICLGDVVGYGANPNECVDVLRSNNIPTIAGNHDRAVTGAREIDNFSEHAQAGVVWTRKKITKENFEFLSNLPYILHAFNAFFTHSSPDLPEEFRYLFYHVDAAESFQYFSEPVCFVGHTHRPAIFCDDGETDHLVKGKKFIVNAGSVGQPRNGDWHACFVVFDVDNFSLEYVRVEYDVRSARQKILDAGLPKKLGDRLLSGV